MTGIRDHLQARPIRSQHAANDGPRDELFDWRKLRSYAVFSLRSIGRRPFLFLSVSAGMVSLAALALNVLPKTYEVEAQILAQRTPALAVRADSSEMEPTRAAAATIVQRDNLHALMQQTELLQEWPKHRAALVRAEDWLRRLLHLMPTDEELAERLADVLQEKLIVWTTATGLVTIKLSWPDPVMAYRLVDAAQQNFLEKRHVLEVSTIAEEISILEGHAANLSSDVKAQIGELERLREHSAPEGTRAAPPPAPARRVNPEVLNLRAMLHAKRRAIADLEEFWRRHRLELQTRMAEQRAIYSETHPIVLDLQRGIDLLQHDSPQLTALRREQADLRRRLPDYSEDAAAASPDPPAIQPEFFRDSPGARDASVDYARAQLGYATQQYAALRGRIDAARIDLDTARAAFKYRYVVVAPPQVPRGPIKPRAPPVIVAALVAGLLLALFATTAADFRAGIVWERWQVEDLLPSHSIIDVHLPRPPVGEFPASGSPPV
jgi:uncharacterized protein involved in exopolysaccharide biosynthesis